MEDKKSILVVKLLKESKTIYLSNDKAEGCWLTTQKLQAFDFRTSENAEKVVKKNQGRLREYLVVIERVEAKEAGMAEENHEEVRLILDETLQETRLELVGVWNAVDWLVRYNRNGGGEVVEEKDNKKTIVFRNMRECMESLRMYHRNIDR